MRSSRRNQKQEEAPRRVRTGGLDDVEIEEDDVYDTREVDDDDQDFVEDDTGGILDDDQDRQFLEEERRDAARKMSVKKGDKAKPGEPLAPVHTSLHLLKMGGASKRESIIPTGNQMFSGDITSNDVMNPLQSLFSSLDQSVSVDAASVLSSLFTFLTPFQPRQAPKIAAGSHIDRVACIIISRPSGGRRYLRLKSTEFRYSERR